MVAFIHGGSNDFGSNDETWGDNQVLRALAKQGLSVVGINYRLGPYGYFYLKETEEGQRFRGNWGLQDQTAALQWISMYGGVFGGNKDHVTLDGCSAGSFNGFTHMSNPESWPYFKAAVLTGIGVNGGSLYEGERTDFIYDQVLQAAGVSSVDELRTMTTGEISTAMTIGSQIYQGRQMEVLAANDPADGTLPERLDIDAPSNQPYSQGSSNNPSFYVF